GRRQWKRGEGHNRLSGSIDNHLPELCSKETLCAPSAHGSSLTETGGPMGIRAAAPTGIDLDRIEADEECGAVETLVVGVAGGTGSGKTTLTKALLDKCEGPPSVLYHDNYYRRRDELSYEEREQVNYDDLDAFDNDLFVDHLTALRAGRPVESPVYDFSIHN